MKNRFCFNQGKKDKMKRVLTGINTRVQQLNEDEKKEFLNKIFNPSYKTEIES